MNAIIDAGEYVCQVNANLKKLSTNLSDEILVFDFKLDTVQQAAAIPEILISHYAVKFSLLINEAFRIDMLQIQKYSRALERRRESVQEELQSISKFALFDSSQKPLPLFYSRRSDMPRDFFAKANPAWECLASNTTPQTDRQPLYIRIIVDQSYEFYGMLVAKR